MLLILALSLPAIVQTQPSDWDRAKAELDALLHEKGGMGMLFSVEQKKPGVLVCKSLQRDTSDSAWQLEILPVDPITKLPGKGEMTTREEGFTGRQARPDEQTLRLPEGTRQMLFRLRTARFKGLAKPVDIPDAGAPAKVFYFHLPPI